MSDQHVSSSGILAASPGASGSPDTRLHGRWLLVARVGWIGLALLIVGLNAGALPRYYADISNQLTPADMRTLHALGLSIGLLVAYRVMLDAVSVLVWSLLAALLFWRQSHDRMALFAAYMLVTFGGAAYTTILQEALPPLSPVWSVLVGVLDLIGQVCFITFWFLFPNGRFVPRWTRWCSVLAVLVWGGSIFFPIGILNQNSPFFGLPLLALLSCTLFAQIYRYRRVSTPGERQQTKWAVFGFVLAIGGFGLYLVGATLLSPSSQFFTSLPVQFITNTSVYVLIILIPIFIVIAILRSRLWDIDTIINKALVYGLLTGLLGALYAGLIIGLENLIGLFSGQATSNPLVLVISTLAIAALFLPARQRIQSIIDRRFYRKKYDAEKTLAAFSASLRQEVDLEQIRERLIAVVQETMQPAHVSLWLAQPERRGSQQSTADTENP